MSFLKIEREIFSPSLGLTSYAAVNSPNAAKVVRNACKSVATVDATVQVAVDVNVVVGFTMGVANP